MSGPGDQHGVDQRHLARRSDLAPEHQRSATTSADPAPPRWPGSGSPGRRRAAVTGGGPDGPGTLIVFFPTAQAKGH
ncbi:MAG: hypothetical protein R2711_07445 [Acidimicrobiales bacterium]